MQGKAIDGGLGRARLVWAAGMVLYAGARALFVGATLAEYGLLPWLFFLLDAGSVVLLVLGQVRILEGLRQRNPPMVQQWAIIAATAFITPYAYLVLGGDRPLPTAAYVGIAVYVLGDGAATVWRIRSKKRALQANRLLP